MGSVLGRSRSLIEGIIGCWLSNEVRYVLGGQVSRIIRIRLGCHYRRIVVIVLELGVVEFPQS
jgi:hypothetical protein